MIGLDPQATWEVGFEHEANLPAAERTFLRCRFLTARQYIRIGELMEEANGGPESAVEVALPRRLELLGQAIGIAAEDWVKPGGGVEAFDAARLPDTLTIEEHWELAASIRSKSRLSEQDRKKSALQSASAAMAKSASDAPAPNA